MVSSGTGFVCKAAAVQLAETKVAQLVVVLPLFTPGVFVTATSATVVVAGVKEGLLSVGLLGPKLHNL